MDADRLSYLLEGHHKGTLSTEEAAALEQWYQQAQSGAPLVDEHNENAKHVFRNEMWQAFGETITAAGTSTKTPVKTIVRRWVAVAAVLIIAVPIGLRLAQKKQEPSAAPDLLSVKKVWDTITNPSTVDSMFYLPDGSTTALAGHSSLRYRNGFDSTERNIWLISGKAFFDVVKDSRRPFTVYSQTMATTALGTSFTVSQQYSGEVLVKLHSGKVVVRCTEQVHAFTPVYLTPGKELLVRTRDMLAMVRTFNKPIPSKKAEPVPSDKTIIPKQLQFNQARLESVFAQLSVLYQQEITLSVSNAERFDFSGTIHLTDSLEHILGKISKLNGLSVTRTEKGFSISK